MTEASFTIDVQAPFERIWKLLIDKIDHPERYVPNVTDVEILERGEDFVLRRMKVRGITLTERIEILPEHRMLTFELVDHPEFTGSIANVISGPDDALFLTFSGGWTRHDGSDGPDLTKAFEDAVLRTKVAAEGA